LIKKKYYPKFFFNTLAHLQQIADMLLFNGALTGMSEFGARENGDGNIHISLNPQPSVTKKKDKALI
jgi:hypothetical protein